MKHQDRNFFSYRNWISTNTTTHKSNRNRNSNSHGRTTIIPDISFPKQRVHLKNQDSMKTYLLHIKKVGAPTKPSKYIQPGY
jgi:hypothetical protein